MLVLACDVLCGAGIPAFPIFIRPELRNTFAIWRSSHSECFEYAGPLVSFVFQVDESTRSWALTGDRITRTIMVTDTEGVKIPLMVTDQPKDEPVLFATLSMLSLTAGFAYSQVPLTTKRSEASNSLQTKIVMLLL